MSWGEFPRTKAAIMVDIEQQGSRLKILSEVASLLMDQLDYQRVIYEIRRQMIQPDKSHDHIPRMDLLVLLSFTSYMRATDPRDKL